jgi:hypothetical protein
LAVAADVSLRTVTKIEGSADELGVRLATIMQIKKTFEAKGIEFITAADGSPGIVIR